MTERKNLEYNSCYSQIGWSYKPQTGPVVGSAVRVVVQIGGLAMPREGIIEFMRALPLCTARFIAECNNTECKWLIFSNRMAIQIPNRRRFGVLSDRGAADRQNGHTSGCFYPNLVEVHG